MSSCKVRDIPIDQVIIDTDNGFIWPDGWISGDGGSYC